jgi:hypothetical protein
VERGTSFHVSVLWNGSTRQNLLLSDDVGMADGDRNVLSSLPRTRPERRSAKRGARSPAAAGAAAPASAKPAAPRTKPKPARAKAKAKAKAAPQRKIPPAGYAVPREASPVGSGGAELVATAVQALGELAQMGASVGGRAVRDVLGRLPRP